MSDFDDTNTFVLFINDKGDNPKRPDRTGKANVNGTWYKMSGWVKDGKSGKFLSGKLTPMEEERPKTEKPKAAPVYKGEFDDDASSVPF